ncbi:MAG: ABC-F family ATP-binding cassette domain-containing protein [Bacteroidetes bacterium]|nr:ABC-F family ATP-binding cassette domain-containing protein [Bacteroidota bacterium]
MIAANDLGIQFGGEYLFQGVSFMISPGERIGLVGSNGAGKTTLMRALLGQQQTDEGRISIGRHAVIGYLPQEGVVLSDVSVREEVMKAFGEVMAMEREIEQMTAEIGGRTDHESPEFLALLEELGELQHRFEAMNGFSATGAVDKVLMGLGFRPDDLERRCGEFSGGWQMRIELAKLLLKQPDLLMLDEPTNHLDIESLTWLETFLVTYPGSILLISHDRAFLDAITNRTFELSMGRLTAYTGNYAMYLKLRTERRQLQQAAYENQQKMIADTEKFIERFRYKATKATQVQSRVKALDRLDRVAPVEAEESSVHFSFPPAPRSGRDVVEMKHVSKSYGLLNVLNDVSFVLERGEKVAFLGRNGEGKSTFSRMIAGIEPHDGERIVGHNVSIGYFAQHQAEELDPRRTVLETLDAVATGEIRTRLRTLLGAFLFQGDDVFKSVGVLSGGEKSRLALAKLLLEPVNLLIFDEPTNHLDMRSKEVLKQALIAFDGALVIVSHDRDFLNGIVGKCVEFKDRKIREYIGGIEDYLRRHQTATIDQVFTRRSAVPVESGRTAAADNAGGLSQKERKRLEAEARNRRYAATKELRKRLAGVEDSIQKLETEKGTIEEQLNDPAVIADFERARRLQMRLSEIVNKLAGLYDDWSKVAGEIERAEAEA